MRLPFLFLFTILLTLVQAQPGTPKTLQAYQIAKKALLNDLMELDSLIEEEKLGLLREDLQAFGIPALEEGETLIQHSALTLVYSEAHEQAKWVAHAITPDVLTGRGFRSNDFRPDPMVTTGTAVEQDYFLKKPTEKGEFKYDSFGYDRGHLAPSADFRWSKKALSESYFYSNISPQLSGFNREIWADLENALRVYLNENPASTLYVTTGPIFNDQPSVIERSINAVAVPEYFFKVVIDRKNDQGIGFLVPHREATVDQLPAYTVSIDIVEKASGLDFFSGLPEEEEKKLEQQKDIKVWLPEQAGNVPSFTLRNIPREKAYPAPMAKKFIGKKIEISVCGTIVGGRYSRAGNLLLNLDRQYPNHIFTIFIRKENLPNFSYNPLDLKSKQVCSKSEVKAIGGIPTMFLEDEAELEVIDR